MVLGRGLGPDSAHVLPPRAAPGRPLARRARAAIPGTAPIIGGDIAITSDGPVVIEANIPPSSALQQVPTRIPLGETAVVPTILAHHRAAYD